MTEPQRVALSAEHFEIEFLAESGLLNLTVRGDWDEYIVADFVSSLQPIVKADGATITHSLVDAVEIGPLSPLVVEGLMPLIDPDPEREMARIAIVLPDLLNRAQSRPVAELVNARFFMSMDLARDWLFSSEA